MIQRKDLSMIWFFLAGGKNARMRTVPPASGSIVMNATKPLFRAAGDRPVQSSRRGVCPSLSRPMQTGDGLLARLRPASGGFRPDELKAVAVAARDFGNGILEVTARGNLQVRGLKPDTVEPLTQAVFATGMDIATGLAVETPPLSGIDPNELVDARPLAAAIRMRVASSTPSLKLAAKLSVVIDGGGMFNLDAIVADIRLKAVRDVRGLRYALLLGGDATTARPVCLLEAHEAVDAVMMVLEMLHRMGSDAAKPSRGKDVDPGMLPLPGLPLERSERPVPAGRRPAGLHRLGPDLWIAGVGLTYCQARTEALVALVEKTEALGGLEFRLAPEHGFLVPFAREADAREMLDFAQSHGFLTEPDHPANHVALCAGTAGCASAYFDTHAVADLFIREGAGLLDGSFTLHLSACPKGCAHPAATLLGLSGASLGYGLVVNGSASASPDAYIAANDVTSAVERLAALVRTEKQAGETARDCLNRLGADGIATALRRKD